MAKKKGDDSKRVKDSRKYWRKLYQQVDIPCINDCICGKCGRKLVIRKERHYCTSCAEFTQGNPDCGAGE